MQTNDRAIIELMKGIHDGKMQLPDFQRGWVWDDSRIKALIASITNNFPVGAAMFLEYGNQNIRFKYRVIEGSPSVGAMPAMQYKIPVIRLEKETPKEAVKNSFGDQLL